MLEHALYINLVKMEKKKNNNLLEKSLVVGPFMFLIYKEKSNQ